MKFKNNFLKTYCTDKQKFAVHFVLCHETALIIADQCNHEKIMNKRAKPKV